MILACINAKGGTAKTTTAVSLSAALAGRGKRILLIDLDSQASASMSLGVVRDDLSPSVADALLDGRPLKEVIRKTGIERLDLVTGSDALMDADLQLANVEGRERILAAAIAPIRAGYDFIILDCPPSLSLIPVNALVAADAFLVPTPPEYLALEGLVGLMKAVDRIHAGIGDKCHLLGIVLTKVDRRRRVTDEVVQLIRDHYGSQVFKTEVRVDTKLVEAPSFGKDIFAYASGSTGAEAYGLLADEVIRRQRRGALA